MSDLREVKNIGEKMEAMLISVGITTKKSLLDLGAPKAQLMLLQSGKANHVMYYHALALGVQGRPWNDTDKDEKAKLKAEFVGLQQEAKQSFSDSLDLPPLIAREIAQFGVI